MSDYANLKIEKEADIAVLTISRPEALNALNTETIEELDKALSEIEADDSLTSRKW